MNYLNHEDHEGHEVGAGLEPAPIFFATFAFLRLRSGHAFAAKFPLA
jgi:hypothetical protein